MEPPGLYSPFLRHGDIIRLNTPSSNTCLGVSSTFYSQDEKKSPQIDQQMLSSAETQLFHNTEPNYAALNERRVKYGLYSFRVCVEENHSLLSNLWQVELTTQTTDAEKDEEGSLIRWNSFVRFRHVLTGRYLCLGMPGDDPIIQKIIK